MGTKVAVLSCGGCVKIVTQIWRMLRLLFAMYNLQSTPENPEYVFDISDACNRLDLYGLSREKLFANTQNEMALKEMWLLPEIDLQILFKEPEGSVGHVYATHMLKLGFQPDFWRHSEIKNDITYVTVRMRQTHDLWHVMTGFAVDVEGEIGLQAFVLAQTGLPIAMILVSGALLRATFKSPLSLPKLMDAISQGWQMGKVSRSVFSIRWENVWSRNLIDLQQEFHIPALAPERLSS